MQRFIAADGAVIAYRDEGSGRPLLMLHGLNADARLFAGQADALSDRFRVIRPDFRAHGQSEATPPLDMAQLAEDVAALVRRLDLRDAIGIGWSLGAMVLWRLLLGVEADRFAGAVVIDMTARVTDAPGWDHGLIDEGLRSAPEGESAEARGRRIAGAVLAEGSADDALKAEIAPLLVQPDPAAVAAIGVSLFAEDFRETLAGIAVPTLVVHGGRSRYYSDETARWLAEALPHARAVRFADAGHALHVEQPDAFNRLIADFARDPAEFLSTASDQMINGRIDA